ncbi:MAG: tetratricopeptide repeat protein [Chitinophagaceae bacterium]
MNLSNRPEVLTSALIPRRSSLVTGIVFFILLATFKPLVSSAQSASFLIRRGNQLYQKQAFTDAEVDYKKALDKNKKSSAGYFNLGNSLYQQKRYPDAFREYEQSAALTKKPFDLADTRYNMGNTFMEKKDWKKSISDYEKSLLINPHDADARYNLAYAQMMLKKQKSGGGGKKNQKNNKNQNKNQQNNNKNQPQKQNQDQSKPQPQPSKLTKQEAKQLLDAIAQQEQKIQDKKDKNKNAIPVGGGPNW